jgi:hypothetical protein
MQRQDELVRAGESFTLDATRGGLRVVDPDGDPLSYRVSLRGTADVEIRGTQLSGVLDGGAGKSRSKAPTRTARAPRPCS